MMPNRLHNMYGNSWTGRSMNLKTRKRLTTDHPRILAASCAFAQDRCSNYFLLHGFLSIKRLLVALRAAEDRGYRHRQARDESSVREGAEAFVSGHSKLTRNRPGF